MAYTKHGHHIPGTERYEVEPDKARCGGPGLCGECSREVVMVERNKEKVEARGNFEDADIYKFQTKPVDVEAAWFRGGRTNAQTIVNWINEKGGRAIVNGGDTYPIVIDVFLPDNSFREIESDQWIVIYDSPWEIYGVSSEKMERGYIQLTFPKGVKNADD